MKKEAEIFDQLVQDRRSVRVYDAEAAFDHDAVKRSLERAVLAPNSSNMQLWEFYRVKSHEKLKTLAWMCMNQKAAKTAREMVVVVSRRDLWKKRQQALVKEMQRVYPDASAKMAQRAMNYYKNLIPKYYWSDWFDIWGFLKKCLFSFVGLKRPIVRHGNRVDVRISGHKSAALAAQNFMMSMKAEGYDTCPMEGMDSKRIKRLLHLPRRSEIVMVIGCGSGTAEGIYSDRFRIPNDEVIFEI